MILSSWYFHMPHACFKAFTALWIFVMGPSLFSVSDSSISCVNSSRARPSISWKQDNRGGYVMDITKTGNRKLKKEKKKKNQRVGNEVTDRVCSTAVLCVVTPLVGTSVAWQHKERMWSRLLLIGLGFKLDFVPIFYFSVPRARKPLPVPRLSNIHMPPTQATASTKNSPL